MNPHSYRLKGRDFVHQGKIEIDVNERAAFIRTQGCFFVYTNSDCFLNNLQKAFRSLELDENSVTRKFRVTASDGKNYDTNVLDMDHIGIWEVNTQWSRRILRWLLNL